MPHASLPALLPVVLSLLAGTGCSSDQKNVHAPASSSPSSEASTDTSTQPGGEVARPSGENVSPSSPEAQSDGSANTLAMPGSPAAQPAPPQLSEAQIAMLTELANGSEIEQGKFAQTKAKQASVKRFAALMVKHHTAARQEQSQLYRSLSLAPANSPQATALKDAADETLGKLRATDPSAFDVAYIDSQITAHQNVLDTIDHELTPSATDRALSDGLKKMRGTVQAHLDEAKRIRAELERTPAH